MALVTKTFSDIITFARASTATYFNSAGTLTTAAIDAPRLDYNPSTLAAQGLLIEEARTNFALQSQALNSGDQGGSTGWYTITRASISADVDTAPDGTLTADKIVEDTATGTHLAANRTTAGSTTNTNAITVTAFIKASGRTIASILLTEGTTFTRNAQAYFDLTAVNSPTPTVAGGASAATSSITPVSNGWYRCALTVTLGGTDTRVEARFYPTTSTTSVSYTGDGTSGILVWGAQIEQGVAGASAPFPTSYIPTTTTALTRSADVASVNTLSPWYNAAEGTIYAEGTGPIVTLYRILAEGATASDYKDFSLAFDGLRGNFASRYVAGNFDVVGPSNSLTAGATAKLAGSYSSTSADMAYNGLLAVTKSAVAQRIPADRVFLGSRLGTSLFLNGHIRRITYYPRRLANADLQTITT